MARDRDWVDYANLASNVIQNAQLNGLNGKMQELAELTRQKADEERRETILRDAVFQADTLLRSLRKISKENPGAAMAWATHALLQFERNGVTSASFRSYEDKERLRSVTEGHEQMVEHCAASLSLQQQDQAKRCGQYLAERDDLNLLIKLSGKQEERRRLLMRLREIGDETKPRQNLASLLCLGGIGLCSIGGTALGLAVSDNTNNPIGILPLVLGGALFVAGAGIQRQLELRIRETKAHVAQLVKDEPLLDPSCGVIDGLRKTFGDAKNADLLVMQRDREALIAEVLGIPKRDAGGSL